MDKRALIAAGVILVIPILMLVIWASQSQSMESDFATALRSGAVMGVHRDLQGKQWSAEELATIEVLEVPETAREEQVIKPTVQARGPIYVSADVYQFQATVCDESTDIVYVFGYRRSEPQHWCWEERFHPDRMQVQLEQRPEQSEEITKQTSTSGQAPPAKH